MEADDSHLDPRIYKELEKLNKASEEINCLEVELDNARASFRQILNESITQLNSLSKRLGGSVDKARPYYDARKKALEAQLCTQNAAIKFEKACSQLAAAKEMVNLAEQGYFKMGQTFDPAWQEMLNHSTIRVNDAEKERLECEVAHRMTTFIFNETEQNVRRMQKEYKRSISKSKPYFELKARYNQMMEGQKKKVERLEASVSKSKYIYSETLRSLEMISDEIHKKRGTQRKHRRKVARSKRPNQIYHPLMDASEVIIEEVSSPSPDEKLIRELDALHLQNDVDNKTSNHIKKHKKIRVHTNDDVPRPNKYKMLDETGDAKDSLKHLNRPFTSSLIEYASASTKRQIDANTESPKLKIPFSEQSWNELLSPMKLMSSETLFRAPINPLRVENLSTERVNQKLCMSGHTFTEDELIQKTSEDRVHTLMTKGTNRNAAKNHFKVAKDKTYKANEKNRKVTKSSGDQSSFHCQKNDQKNLSSKESVKIQNIFTPVMRASPGPETLKPTGYFDLKDPSRDSSPEKQDALQQTSYSFLVDRRDALQQTSFQSLGKKDFYPRRVSWGRGVITTEINDSENSKKSPQSVSHHHKVKDDQLWKFPFHPLTHNSQVIPSYNVTFDSQVIQRSKTSPSPTSFQLPPSKMEQNQAEANSETESIASSLNSASLLDDDQVESLMMETSQYHSFLSQMDAQESECFSRLTLPNKLRYLKNLVNFDPIWLDGYDDNDDDDEIGNHNRANVSHTSLFDEQIFRSDDAEEELVDDECNNENFREHFSDNECDIKKSNENEDQYIGQFDSMLTNLKKVTFEDVGARKSLPLSQSDGFNDSESVELNSRILNLNNKTTPRMANKNKN